MRAVVFLAFLALLTTPMVNALKEPPTKLQIGIKKRIPEEECTKRSRDGDLLSMHYTGTLFDTGAKFDSSVDRNQPLEFTLGKGQVIQGWDQGLKNMCVGEKRRLVIPPELAYGDRGAGSAIPPGSTLVFEVELMDVKSGERIYPGAPGAQASSPGLLDTIDFESPIFLAGAAVILVVIGLIAKSLFGGKTPEVTSEKQTEKDEDQDTTTNTKEATATSSKKGANKKQK